MINIDPALKTIYRNDRFPMSSVAHPKDMEAYFAGLDLTVLGDQFAEDKGGFELSEGICRDSDLKFGKCNAAQVKFTVADVSDDIAGKEFRLKQIVDNTYEMPFGYYTVETCPKQDDLRFKDITAYDRMKKTNIDVAAWYNGLTLPMTLGAFRSSLLTYFGLVEDTSNLPLPNDSMTVEKTILPAQLQGQELIEKIEELNGVFGAITPDGKFGHVILKPAYGDYPTNDYPQNDYPISANDTSYVQPNLIDETITIPMRETIRFEEYTVQEIDKLIIRGEEDDIGAIVGAGTNAYVIEGNYLVYGKTAAQLQAIATNAYGYMAKRPYRPYNTRGIGLPYVKPGDMLKFYQDEPVTGYVLSRTLTGAQGLMDEFASKGNQQRKQNTSQNTEIVKLKYRVTKLKVDIDGVLIEVADLEAATSAAISVLSDNINLKVDKNGVVAAINISPEEILIRANKINFNGYAEFNAAGGLTSINGSVLKTGTVIADSVRSNWVYAGYLSADQIVGGTISGVVFISSDGIRTTRISQGAINSDYAYISFLEVPTQINVGSSIQMTASDGSITCNKLNGGYPITDATISYQSVLYASVAGTVQSIPSLYTNQIYASDTGYGNIDFLGFDNAAGVNWVRANFQPKTPSDLRLKYNILPMDDIPDELFYSLKPYQFKYKTSQYGEGKFFGIIEQQLENAFRRHGLNPFDYDLIEVKDVRKYTDDGYYVKEKTRRINYNNFIAWLIKIAQNQNNRITELENIIKSLT